MSEWQPIETAPTDETEILLWDAAYDHMRVGWHAVGYRLTAWVIGYDETGCILADNPTYWMLPERPASTENGKPVLISSQDAAKVAAKSYGMPPGYVTADVRGSGPAADMESPENSPAEIKRRRDLAFAECSQSKMNSTKERIVPETTPDAEQKQPVSTKRP